MCEVSFFNNYYYTHKKVERAWILCSRPFSFLLLPVSIPSAAVLFVQTLGTFHSPLHIIIRSFASPISGNIKLLFFFFFSPIAAGYYCPFFIFEMDSLNMMEDVY